jgi:hypothetical protein
MKQTISGHRLEQQQQKQHAGAFQANLVHALHLFARSNKQQIQHDA